jgi:uncharacterized lipoprotein YmbA
MRLARIVAVTLVWAALLVACVRTPEIRYYTLSADGPARQARTESPRFTVRVGPASVPEALDRPELVLRVSATELVVDDSHHWAEPLRTGIARAVAGGLARELDGARVVVADERITGESTDVEVLLDVQRLDAKLGDGVAIDVAWVVRSANVNGGPIHTGRSVTREPLAPGSSYDPLVEACARALATLSREIARSVRADYLSRR